MFALGLHVKLLDELFHTPTRQEGTGYKKEVADEKRSTHAAHVQ